MPQYQYEARDSRGNFVKGAVEAVSSKHAAELLFAKNVIPLKINEQRTRFSFEKLKKTNLFGGVKNDDLAFFCRQMHALIKAGVPLLASLKLLTETTHSIALSSSLMGVIEYISSGLSLTEALRKYPKIFPPVFTNLVDAGEETGQLDRSFLELSGYLFFQSETIKQIISAIRYPVLVIIGMTLSLIIIMVYAMPKFTALFKSFGSELPLITRIVIGISDFIGHNWFYIVGAVFIIFFGFIYFGRTRYGRLKIDRAKIMIPVFGKIIRMIVYSRFTHIFAMVLRSGLPLVDSVELVANAVNNAFYREKLLLVAGKISHGDNLLKSFSEEKIFPPMIMQMIKVGEETGNLDQMLDQAAGYYDREVNYHMQRIQELIQPILLVIVGAMVLVLVLAVMLPMLRMLALFSGGG